MDKAVGQDRLVALWSKSLSDDTISVLLKYKKSLKSDLSGSLEVGIEDVD